MSGYKDIEVMKHLARACTCGLLLCKCAVFLGADKAF